MPEWQVEPLVNELKAMKRRMDTLYQKSCGGPRETEPERESACEWQPAVDILETPTEWRLMADLPGVPEEALRVEIVDKTLRISGNRPLPAEASGDSDGSLRVVRSERSCGSFCRSVAIPGDAREDAIQAELKLGVLKVTVPKQHASRGAEHKVAVNSW
ncbi:MAG: Hsp20/alpha crystallin family protein [Syntrophobacteraceae bacterium]